MTAHELRNPVAAIKLNAQILQRRGSANERLLATILDQTERLGGLIEDLQLAASIEADRLVLRTQALDLATEARETARSLRSEAHPIAVEAPSEPLIVSADRLRIGQVLTNLLTNAIKYSPAGREVVVRLSRGAEEARVAVIDRGIGIPRTALPRLFERFYRVDPAASRVSGLGLGLYICRRLVEAHGGRIEVDSEPGAGSTFTIVLPLPTA
jgi:signal transduction histidine kinase